LKTIAESSICAMRQADVTAPGAWIAFGGGAGDALDSDNLQAVV